MESSHQEVVVEQEPTVAEAAGSLAVELSLNGNGEVSQTEFQFSPEGWVTKSFLAQQLSVASVTVSRIADEQRDTFPEWFSCYRDRSNHVNEHYSPELAKLISDTITAIEKAPDGWKTNLAISELLGVSSNQTKKLIANLSQLQPELVQVKTYRTQGGHVYEHYSPDTITKLQEILPQKAPEGWVNNAQLSSLAGYSEEAVRTAAKALSKEHPEWVQVYKGTGHQTTLHYHPDLVSAVCEKFSSQLPPPDEWRTNTSVSEELEVDFSTVKKCAESFREQHPEWFGLYLNKKRRLSEHYHPDLVAEISKSLILQESPEGWTTTFGLAAELGVAYATVRKIAQEYSDSHPEWFKIYKGRGRQVTTHYHPQLVKEISRIINSYEPAPDDWLSTKELSAVIGVVEGTVKKVLMDLGEKHPALTGLFKSKGKIISFYHPSIVNEVKLAMGTLDGPPEGWMNAYSFSKLNGFVYHTVQKKAENFRNEHPEWYEVYRDTTNKLTIHYHPDLLRILEAEMIVINTENEERERSKKEKRELEKNLREYLESVMDQGHEESEKVWKLIRLFGEERIVDILFQHRPDYQKLDLPYVRRIIGEYLGDFLTIRGDLELENLEENVEYLANPSLKEGLTEIVKNDCLRFYNEKHKEDPTRDDQDILALYIDDLRSQTIEFQTTELAEIIDEVAKYYRSLFEDFQKPDCLVDELKDGRRFPDLNQRINIKEIELKQKMLIADEMGVGKSASAILAKESLGVKQALIVVPSNVIDVWQTYLSDKIAENGDAAGYFKPGQVPKVLVVNGLKELRNVDPDDYDYVILSHERLTQQYMDELERFDYGMLIVDEVHKLKNISEGVRAENLIKLVARIEEGDENKYLALLSGTPVPNLIEDVAMILRLLYPEKFEHIGNKELTRQILKGDVLNLRSLLVPRMQMKSLAESIEMPNLHEELHEIELSDIERQYYEILLEEDELTASQKLQNMRQFLLNPYGFDPEGVDPVPDLESTKIRAVGDALRNTYQSKDKVVMFINGYVERVIRGEKTIFERLGLPEDVQVEVIEGNVSKAKRLEIQSRLQKSNGKMLLAVSGMTADVGVDFSGAQDVFMYNEPWTEYVKKQEIGRVFRPGLAQDITVHTFYIKNTIEEGIHRYIGYKYQAIEKLLRGIPLSELEQKLLKADETKANPDLDVSPALAEHYLSASGRLFKIFNHVKEIGEKDFLKFLDRYGKEYAESYRTMGGRSYQANAGRLSGTVIDRLVRSKRQDPEFVRILDVASGPEMLKRHISEEYQEQVVSVDINPEHFDELDDKRRIGSFLNLPVADTSVDYANLSLALHYSKLSLKQRNYERVEVLKELNRVLVSGGTAVINTMHNLDLKNPEIFEKAAETMGFKVVERYTGEVSSGNNFRTRLIVLQKFSDCPKDTSAVVKALGAHIVGFKFKRTSVELKDSRRISTSFILGNGRKINARFNQSDKAILTEEQKLIKLMNHLKRLHKDIKNIPAEQLLKRGLSRAFTGRTYVLFKSLESGNGAVITR